MEITKRALGESHPNVAYSLTNLAELYRALENPAAGLFVGFSSLMIFGMTMLVAFLLFLSFFGRRT